MSSKMIVQVNYKTKLIESVESIEFINPTSKIDGFETEFIPDPKTNVELMDCFRKKLKKDTEQFPKLSSPSRYRVYCFTPEDGVVLVDTINDPGKLYDNTHKKKALDNVNENMQQNKQIVNERFEYHYIKRCLFAMNDIKNTYGEDDYLYTSNPLVNEEYLNKCAEYYRKSLYLKYTTNVGDFAKLKPHLKFLKS